MSNVQASQPARRNALLADSIAGLIVFLVALPLCLGIAFASGAPLFSGVVAGIVGGIVVGLLSGSHTSVSGPAAGLTAIVSAQIADLKTFETFLLAVVIGGALQIVLGVCKAGALSAFFPSSVIKGLLAAIGTILILKQIPHLLGHDKDPEGEMSFDQPDKKNTFTEFFDTLMEVAQGDIQATALTIGLVSLLFLIVWDLIKPLKKSLVPAPLLVVILGVVLGQVLNGWGGRWILESSHLVQVPVANSLAEFKGFLQFPDFSALANPAVYTAGVVIAIVASLETLLNLDAVDKLDRHQRISPPSRELLAQGAGNVISGLLGGLPMTAVVIRGSVNVNAGAETKLSAVLHGVLLLVCVVFAPTYLNMIPLSCLAAILLMTGYKLASPKLFAQMWSQGKYQFLPFILTLVAIVFTDLLKGVLIGLAIALVFILHSNLRRPIRRVKEKHIEGEVLHIELSNQVSFLNRAALENALREAPRGGSILLDARRTDYIDPDILSLIKDFQTVTAPALGVQLRVVGLREQYKLSPGQVQSVDLSPQDRRDQLTPSQVVELLAAGNQRFTEGRSLDHDLRHGDIDGKPPQPIAAIVTGVDSRTPVEMIFDLGLGDALVVRMPAVVVSSQAIGGLEFAHVHHAIRLVVVMGHADSQLLRAAASTRLATSQEGVESSRNLATVLDELRQSIDDQQRKSFDDAPPAKQLEVQKEIARRQVLRTVQKILDTSPLLKQRTAERKIAIVGALYDVTSGRVEFLTEDAVALSSRAGGV